jgi:hypothetical protein|tara:strand:+ start:140 stop:421 length:282 start_codon:yes stop_codon:yes gene_type:complete
MTKQKIENHTYVGFHNAVMANDGEKFISFSHTNKMFAKEQCEKLLLKYFHDISRGCTLYSLDHYNGVVAYVGIKYSAPKYKRNMATKENRISN